ncbi:unnamed protein product [Mytilus coruscus]|uniref:SWIM-type domain-containing protein n=1 Tax=Mytilus coruscus TaxID=42192 RepID=A0A6J8EBX4_MYTCO|nr:unnamed protein product [Mytilus coruscus]
MDALNSGADKVVSNHFVPYIGDFVRIVSAFINCFRAPLINDFCNEELGQTMLDRAQLGNQTCRDRPNLLRVKLTSRHSSSRVYSLWIEFSGDEVTGWYCTCKVGARVVGYCAHIASTMWYLGYSRWELETPSTCKYADSILNAKDVPLETDSDSDSDGFIEE